MNFSAVDWQAGIITAIACVIVGSTAAFLARLRHGARKPDLWPVVLGQYREAAAAFGGSMSRDTARANLLEYHYLRTIGNEVYGDEELALHSTAMSVAYEEYLR